MRLAELIRTKESTKIDRIKRFNGRNRTICDTKSAKSTGLTLIRKFDRIDRTDGIHLVPKIDGSKESTKY